ncbi:MAG: hypothetical protein K2G99_07120, partial [Desulfovibrio sp.]|nr:hypothetical protein [Desulfovibrio sp.]
PFMPDTNEKDISPIEMIREKYGSSSRDDCLLLYCGLITNICNITFLDKQSFLQYYENICTSFFLSILSRYNNMEFPEVVDREKQIFEDVSYSFLYHINKSPRSDISIDELKIAALQAKVACTETLKRNNDLYE